MAGLYFHVPFCKQACSYCDFYFVTRLEKRADLVEALCKEVELRVAQGEFLGHTIETIYFGGGTPSLLAAAELHTIVDFVKTRFSVIPDAEITLEANPDDVSPEKLKQLRQIGFNRVSIGVQSFDDRELQQLHRAHNSQQAHQAIKDAFAAGFENTSIDLIFNLPNQSLEQWKHNLETALTYPLKHISIYGLTVEPRTRLAAEIENGHVSLPDEELFIQQFEYLRHRLTAAGFEHYEISNFAKPGFRSRHNSSYWKGLPYWGFGPGAHSFGGTVRTANVRNLNRYLTAIRGGSVPVAVIERLTLSQRRDEVLLTSLRTIEGVRRSEMASFCDEEELDLLWHKARTLEDWCTVTEDNIGLTNEGLYCADWIMQQLAMIFL
jgi:oxygen-independent coproporphyrinogen-3 oxidase